MATTLEDLLSTLHAIASGRRSADIGPCIGLYRMSTPDTSEDDS